MTIKETEEKTGLPRSNIRFYEKEKLVVPSRDGRNGYRDYSDSDIENIKKIAYLRTLGISIEEIRNIMSEKVTLYEVIQKQNDVLEDQLTDLKRAKALCEEMLARGEVGYQELQAEQYVTELREHWERNRPVFKLDSVSFLYIWGSFLVWAAITALCLLAGLLSYTKLPPEIPVQWSGGAASSLADKKFIFAYPAACIVIRYLLRPVLYAKLYPGSCYGEMVTEYLTNYLCFLALSAELFSILFVYGAVQNIVLILAVDTVVLLGLLVAGVGRLNWKGRR